MATTVVNNLFPPQVETFQPAFIYNEDPWVSFSISSFNKPTDIRFLHISVVDQRNNENALLGTTTDYFIKSEDADCGYGIINGILIVDFPQSTDSIKSNELIQYDRATNKYKVRIPRKFLRQTQTVKVEEPKVVENEYDENGDPVYELIQETKYFNVGQYYKVQLRFDCYTKAEFVKWTQIITAGSDTKTKNKEDAIEKYVNYLVNQRPYFSEWSEVSLIKPILHVNFLFPQLDGSTLEGNLNKLKGLNPGITPISATVVMEDKLHFYDRLDENSDHLAYSNEVYDGLTDETEHVERYRITVYPMDEQGIVDYDVVNYQSDWEFTSVREDTQTAEYGVLTTIEISNKDAGNFHALVIEYYTNNNYYGTDIRYFETTMLEELNPPRWNIRNDAPYRKDKSLVYVDQEDGIAKIRFRWNRDEASEGRHEWQMSTGVLYIRRASSLDNFKEWKLMSVNFITEEDIKEAGECIAVDFDDYTLCSMVRYRYSAQYHCLKFNTRDKKAIPATWTEVQQSAVIYMKFYDMLLERQNRQIAIRYNGQITSWKPVVNRQKVDTLGGRYPKFVENAQMNYRQFSINGLISAEGDFNRTFLNEFDGEYIIWEPSDNDSRDHGDYVLEGGKYRPFQELADQDVEVTYDFKYLYNGDMVKYDEIFDGKRLLRNDTVPDGEYGWNPKKQINEYQVGVRAERFKTATGDDTTDEGYAYNKSIFMDESLNGEDSLYYEHDIYPVDNWYWERTFRDELVKWLNDGEPKLYRSMPEGNMAVMLTDISLTPNAQLGRRLYNFSATVYEIGDGNDLEVLDSLGIFTIPKIRNKYGEYYTIYNEESDEPTDDEDLFSTTITQVGQLWFPRLYGEDEEIINKDKATYLWDKMSILERIKSQYKGVYGNYTVKPGTLKLSWVRFQYASKPKYYIADKMLSGSKIGTNWQKVDMQGKEISKENDSGNEYYSINNKNYYTSDNRDIYNTYYKEGTTFSQVDTFSILPTQVKDYNKGLGCYVKGVIEFENSNFFANQNLPVMTQEYYNDLPEEEKPKITEVELWKGDPFYLEQEYQPTIWTDEYKLESMKKRYLDFYKNVIFKDYAWTNQVLINDEEDKNDPSKWQFSLKNLSSNYAFIDWKQLYGKYKIDGLPNEKILTRKIVSENGNFLEFYYIKTLATMPTFNNSNSFYWYWDKDDTAVMRSLKIIETSSDPQTIKPTEYSYSDSGYWNKDNKILTIKVTGENVSKLDVSFEYTSTNPQVLSLNTVDSNNPTVLRKNSTMALGYNFFLNNSSIFVNDRGFYQTPKKTDIVSLVLPEQADYGEIIIDHQDDVIIDFIASYKRFFNTDLIPMKTTRVEKLIGQWGGMYPYNKKVREDIYNKYYYVHYQMPDAEGRYEWRWLDLPAYYQVTDENEIVSVNGVGTTTPVGRIIAIKNGNTTIGWKYDLTGENITYNQENNTGFFEAVADLKNYIFESKEEAARWLWTKNVDNKGEQTWIEYIQYLSDWGGISVDVTPYTLMQITYPDLDEPRLILVGRSGTWSVFDDNKVQEIEFLGKRMVQAPKSRQPYLDEWEYVLDDLLSLELGISGEIYNSVNWYDWYNKQSHETQVKVAFYFGKEVNDMREALNEVTPEMARILYPYWLDSYYKSTTDIKKPHYNTVYPIGIQGKTYYYIYYLDDKWYEVIGNWTYKNQTIANIKEGTIVAKVPVYGYVNYRADLLRSFL